MIQSNFTKEEMLLAIKNAGSLRAARDILKCGHHVFHRKIKEYQIDISHFKPHTSLKIKPTKYHKYIGKTIYPFVIYDILSERPAKSKCIHYYYRCKCLVCNKIVIKRCNHVVSEKKRPKTCGCIWRKIAFGGIPQTFWNHCIRDAKSRKINNHEFKITPKYAWELFLKQNRKCIYTGLDISFGITTHDETTASLDRIDSSKGYIKGNVQWVHKTINQMKFIYNSDYFIKMCKLVCKNNP